MKHKNKRLSKRVLTAAAMSAVAAMPTVSRAALSFYVDPGSPWPAGWYGAAVYDMGIVVDEYNAYGDFGNGSIYVYYNAGIPTAQSGYGGYGGSIGDGGTFPNVRVLLHESSHWLGTGTYSDYWYGTHAAALIQQFDGIGATLNGDTAHYWPYGENYDNESSPINDARHVAMVYALREDFGIGSTANPSTSTTATLTSSDPAATSAFNYPVWQGNVSGEAAHFSQANIDYFTGAYAMRTPNGYSSWTFVGNSLTVNSGGSLLFNGYGTGGLVTFNNLIVDGGTVQHAQFSQDLFQLAGHVTLASTGTFDAAQGNINILATMSGSGSFTKVGGYTLTMTAGNAYTGLTSINAGTLAINGEYALGGSVYGGLTFNGGALQYTANIGSNGPGDISQTNFGVARPVTINAGGAIIDTNGNNITYASGIGNAGAGGLTKTGAGTLTLAGTDSYSGGTTLSAGVLNVGNNSAIPAGSIALNGGTLSSANNNGNQPTITNTIVAGGGNIAGGAGTQFNVNGNITGSAALGLSGILNSGSLELAGDNSGYSGTVTVTGANTRLGATTAGSAAASWVVNGNLQTDVVGGGTFQLGALSGTGNISGHANNATLAVSTLTVGALNTNTTFSGSIVDNAANDALTGNSDGAQNNALALNKIGSGSLTLGGANTFTGPTTVTGGALVLGPGGSLAGTTVTVGAASNATLASTGNNTIGTSGSPSVVLTANTGQLSMLNGGSNTLAINSATAGATVLSLAGGNTLSFDSTVSGGDGITLGAGLVASATGSNTVNVNFVERPSAGRTITLINAPGGLNAGTSNFTLNASGVNFFAMTVGLSLTSTQLNLVETVVPAPNTAYFVGTKGTVWGANDGSTGNFSSDSAGSVLLNTLPNLNTDVHFQSTNATSASVASSAVDGHWTINSLTIDGTSSGSVGIAAGTIGVLWLTPTSSSTGFTVNSGAGTVNMTVPVGLGSAQTWTINSTRPVNVTSLISGSNSITKSGSGTLTLGGISTFTGDLTINNGTLVASVGQGANVVTSNLGALNAARNINVNNGGTLVLSVGNVLGNGGTTIVPTATVIVNQGGVLKTGNPSNATGWWNLVGPLALNGGSVAVGSGANTTENAVNSFEGLALMGTVTVGGSTPSTIGNIAGSQSTSNGVHLGANSGANSQITFNVADVTGDANPDLTVSTRLINQAGSGANASGFIKSGPGTMLATGTNTFTGTTSINAGTLSVGMDSNLGASAASVVFNGGALRTTTGITNTHAVTVGSGGGIINVTTTGQYFFNTANTLLGSGALTLTGTGTLTQNTGNLRIGQTNTFNGSVAMTNGGIFEYGVAGAVDTSASFTIGNEGELAVQGGIATTFPNAITVSGGTNSVLSFENGAAGIISGPISLNANLNIALRDWYAYGNVRSGTISSAISGPGGFTVNSGAGSGGTLTLTSAGSFTGNVVVNNSTLVAAEGNNVVNPAATALGNTQTLGRTITINNGGSVVFSAGNVLGSGGQSTAPGVSFIINPGGSLITAAAATADGGNAGGGDANIFGNVTLNGGTFTTGNGYSTAYQAAILLGNVTVGGTAGSTINTNATNIVANGLMLGTSGGVNFNVGSTGFAGADLTVSAPLVNSNSGSAGLLIKSGAGLMALTASNTYTGTTTINGGTLQLGSGTTSGILSPSGAIVNNAVFALSHSDTLTQGTHFGSISGTGSLAQNGNGTVIITANNGYTGATNINAGKVYLTGNAAINGSSAITVNNGATLFHDSSVTLTRPITLNQSTLNGSGTSTGSVTVNSGTITNGDGTTRVLTVGSLSLTAGSVGNININANAATASFGIGVTNRLSTDNNAAGSITLNVIAPLGSFSNPLYELIKYGSFTGSITDFKLGTVVGLSGRQAASLTNDTTDGAIALSLTGTTGNLFWQGTNSGTWSTGTTGNWNNTNNGNTTDDFYTGDLTTFNDTAVGTTTINVSTSGDTPAASVFSNSAKTYTLVGGGITGTGTLSVTGGGTVILNNSNSYTGTTTITSGSLLLGNGGTLGSLSPSSAIVNNSRFVFNRSNTAAQGVDFGTMTGSGSLMQNGTGTVVIAASNAYTGATIINAGTLQLGNGGTSGALSPSSAITDKNVLAFNRTDTITQGIHFSTAAISGAGSLVQNGIGTVVLTTNSYTGGTILNSGTLLAGGATALGTSTLTMNGGALGTTAALTIANPIRVSGTGSVGDASQSNNITLTGALTGSGTLSNVIGGSGNFNVFLNGNLSGFTGTINYTCDSSTSSGAWWRVCATNGSTDLSNASLVINKGTNDLTTGGSKNFGFTDGIGGATLKVGALSGDGVFQASFNATSASTLQVGFLNTSTTFSGVLAGDSAGASMNLTKFGTGTLTLSGPNAFTGNVVVNAGVINAANGVNSTSRTEGPLGNPAVGGRTVTINSNSGVVFSVGNVLGSGGQTTTPALSFIVNGGSLITAAGNIGGPGGGDANIFGNITLNGATLTTGNGYSTAYPAAIMLGTITVGGSSPSTINTNASSTVANGVSLAAAGTTFNVGSVGGVGADLVVSAPLTNAGGGSAGSLTKTGIGAMQLSGSSNYTGTTTVSAGTVTISGSLNAASASGVGQITVGNLASNTGTLNIAGTVNATKTSAPSVLIGGTGTGTGVINLNGGTLNTTSELWVSSASGDHGTLNITSGQATIGSWLAIGRGGNDGNVNVSGGTLSVNANPITIASAAGNVGSMTVTGGTVNANAGVYVGEGGTGQLAVSGTGNLNVTGGLQVGKNSGAIGSVNLGNGGSGGTITTPFVASGGTSTFNLNGGTLRASAGTTSFLQGLTTAQLRNVGGTIDTQAFSDTIAQPLLHSTIGGDNSIDGGLTKAGSGTLILSATSTYTGPTTISAGTLDLTGTLTASPSVAVGSNANLIVDSAGALPSTVTLTGSATTSGVNIRKNQSIRSINSSGSLSITSGNTLTLAHDNQAATGGTPLGTSRINTLALSSSGTLDLTNNGLVVLDTTSLGAVKSLITQAADVSAGVPHWDMPGITSSTAAGDASHAVGYALASTLPNGGSTSFKGITFSDAVIARYTLVGDTGLKGTVDLSDYTKVVLNLGKSNASWSDGNFDYSGNVNLGDYTKVVLNIGRSDGQSTIFNATGPTAQQVKASALTLHNTPSVTQATTATDVTLLVNPTNGRVTLVNALQTGQAVITAYTINSPSQSLLPFSADGGGKYLANALENNPSVFYKASNGLTYNLWTGIKNVSTFIGEGFSNHYNANVDSTWTNYTLATSGYALGTLFKRLSSGGTRDLVFQWEDANLNTYTSVVTYVGAVPEPGSVSLVAAGAMAMLGRRRRRLPTPSPSHLSNTVFDG